MPSFSYNERDFLYNGEPVRVLSGAIHYFRNVPEVWRDRLQKLKEFGCNTVETYLPWNLHEPTPGSFDFSGPVDLVRFVEIAQELGLWVILRPGPYICAEWEFGGLPAWLLADSQVKLRCSNSAFVKYVQRYLTEVYQRITPLQITRSGPIIMVQVENEYGAFGNDNSYVQTLADFSRTQLEIPLFTSDQPSPHMLRVGSATGTLATANFGSKARPRFKALRSIFPSGPKMCAEFWCGWFDHWGGRHHTRSAASAAKALDEILSEGGSVNVYMFHGGTNFGFMNGANCFAEKRYLPTVTSYDYDALLSECGDLTPKYLACRNVMERHFPLPKLSVQPCSPKLPKQTVFMRQSAPLLPNAVKLGSVHHTPTPLTMEECEQATGFILYRTTLRGPLTKARLKILGVRDRAQVFIDGISQGVLFRNDEKVSLEVSTTQDGATLEILVENMGRVNYGPYLADRKGILNGVFLNGQALFGWETISLPMTSPENISWDLWHDLGTPGFYRGAFDVETPADSFVALPGWTKGVCFVNGHNLGRYWARGPQETLYLPAAFLHPGKNHLTVLELHPQSGADKQVRLQPTPVLGRRSQSWRALFELAPLLFPE